MMEWMDEARRRIGLAFDAVGLGPQEAPYRLVATFPGARLRAYFTPSSASGPVLVIVPAPFKRAYIWDLMPGVSVVRRCIGRGLRVYLLEWLVPTKDEDGFGLADYAWRVLEAAIAAVATDIGVSAPILAGHSLGGTFAAIFATLFPSRVGGLVLVDAPLAFGEHGGPLAYLVAAMPHAQTIRRMAGSPVPGSVISALAAVAAPDAFHFQRFADFAASLLDPAALAIHLRVERWAYDEVPLTGQLFEDTLELLYRDDRFLKGTLRLRGRSTGLARLRGPVIAVVNSVGRIVPPGSVLKGLEAASNRAAEVLEYRGDRGPMLQHLGPLVAPIAHERIWPRILDWTAELQGRRVDSGRSGSL
jgi:poly[(R)-3-hydroxyalkanoate] polymerase subunit PhaC